MTILNQVVSPRPQAASRTRDVRETRSNPTGSRRAIERYWYIARPTAAGAAAEGLTGRPTQKINLYPTVSSTVDAYTAVSAPNKSDLTSIPERLDWRKPRDKTRQDKAKDRASQSVYGASNKIGPMRSTKIEADQSERTKPPPRIDHSLERVQTKQQRRL